MSRTEPRTMADEARWRAVLARDERCDGTFVYAVRSTGVYCRPSCPSRKPGRDRVVFFPLPEAAAAAGFRPCKRCRPDIHFPAAEPGLRIARRVCRLIDEHADGVPTLAHLGALAGLSPHRLQRVFKKVVGLSPRQYAEALRAARFNQALRLGEPIASALYGAGYGSPSRVYEKGGARFGMTPASYAKGGRGARIAFTTAACPLGRVLVAATVRGVCAVKLGEADAELEEGLRREFHAARVERDDGTLAAWLASVLDYLEGRLPHLNLPLDVRATAFQCLVWERLRAIPRGEMRTYGEIAAELGRPGQARAVARACATNPVSLVVPCHRAVGAGGRLAGYRWGTARKKALLERERAKK